MEWRFSSVPLIRKGVRRNFSKGGDISRGKKFLWGGRKMTFLHRIDLAIHGHRKLETIFKIQGEWPPWSPLWTPTFLCLVFDSMCHNHEIKNSFQAIKCVQFVFAVITV